MPKSVAFDRDRVMEDVMNLFWEKGYNGTSMQDLVTVTGLNRSSFYNSFGDKFTLYEEALKRYQKQQFEYLSDSLGQYQSPRAAIISFFKGINGEILSGKVGACMMSKCTLELADQDEKIKAFLIDNKDRLVSLFMNLISEAQQINEIDPSKNARILALYLYANLQGIRITAVLDHDLDGVIDQVLSAL